MRLRRKGPLAPATAIRLLRELSAALVYLHARGVVHRDVKPANVLLTRGGDVKLADFGMAFDPEESLASSLASWGPSAGAATARRLGMATGFGTPVYMAPEARLADEDAGAAADPRADLYSLGVTAFEMVIGRRPKGASDRLPTMTSRPRAFDELVGELRATHPSDRPPSAQAVLARLESLRD